MLVYHIYIIISGCSISSGTTRQFKLFGTGAIDTFHLASSLRFQVETRNAISFLWKTGEEFKKRTEGFKKRTVHEFLYGKFSATCKQQLSAVRKTGRRSHFMIYFRQSMSWTSPALMFETCSLEQASD